MKYSEALTECAKDGISPASDPAAMAAFCRDSIQILVGAASPQLVWEGAMAKGMTMAELAELANRSPAAVHGLMWL